MLNHLAAPRPPWEGADAPNQATTSYGPGGIQTVASGHSYPLAPAYAQQLQFMQPQAPRPQPHMGGRGLHHPPPVMSTQGRPAGNYEPQGPTLGDLGRRQMNSHGQLGLEVDPSRVPIALMDKVKQGFYGSVGNWDSSNPQISGPMSGWGADARGGGVMPGPQGPDPRGNAEQNANSESDLLAQQRYKQFQDMNTRSDANMAKMQQDQLLGIR